MQNWFVVVMGIGMVFVVLSLIIVLCAVLGAIARAADRNKQQEPQEILPAAEAAIPNRAELVAAVSAAIAEASGLDASAIRVLSLKKL